MNSGMTIKWWFIAPNTTLFEHLSTFVNHENIHGHDNVISNLLWWRFSLYCYHIFSPIDTSISTVCPITHTTVHQTLTFTVFKNNLVLHWLINNPKPLIEKQIANSRNASVQNDNDVSRKQWNKEPQWRYHLHDFSIWFGAFQVFMRSYHSLGQKVCQNVGDWQ